MLKAPQAGISTAFHPARYSTKGYPKAHAFSESSTKYKIHGDMVTIVVLSLLVVHVASLSGACTAASLSQVSSSCSQITLGPKFKFDLLVGTLVLVYVSRVVRHAPSRRLRNCILLLVLFFHCFSPADSCNCSRAGWRRV